MVFVLMGGVISAWCSLLILTDDLECVAVAVGGLRRIAVDVTIVSMLVHYI